MIWFSTQSIYLFLVPKGLGACLQHSAHYGQGTYFFFEKWHNVYNKASLGLFQKDLLSLDPSWLNNNQPRNCCKILRLDHSNEETVHSHRHNS